MPFTEATPGNLASPVRRRGLGWESVQTENTPGDGAEGVPLPRGLGEASAAVGLTNLKRHEKGAEPLGPTPEPRRTTDRGR